MRAAAVAALLLLTAGTPTCRGAGDGVSWRSKLYPADWTPAWSDADGRFLHDVSYAGYHNGETPLPAGNSGSHAYDAVAEFHADNSGRTDATAAIQAAIAAAVAAGGGVVRLPAGLYRCDGLLTVAGSGLILRGDGPKVTRLFFTRAKGMTGQSHITFRGSVRSAAPIPLAADGVNRAFTVQVRDAAGLAVGQDVGLGWVITDAFVAEHHMAGTWKAFNGKWDTICRRRIASLDLTKTPAEVRLDVPLRYPAKVRDQAALEVESGYIEECGIESLAVSNAVDRDAAWNEMRVHAIAFVGVKDGWIRAVESWASPLPEAKGYHLQNGGMRILDCKRVTVADCRLESAQNRGGGGCGYLFEVSRSNEILFRDCTAIKGRHNFIQNWDFGTTGCVWLRCHSEGSRNLTGKLDPVGLPAYCEFHHSLAMACLVDQCTLADGWYGGNRRDWSSGAGLTVTQSVYWNTSGGGRIQSWQSGWGYIIGTDNISVQTGLLLSPSARGSAPEDYVEGLDRGRYLVPQSLYEDQLKRRLGR